MISFVYRDGIVKRQKYKSVQPEASETARTVFPTVMSQALFLPMMFLETPCIIELVFHS